MDYPRVLAIDYGSARIGLAVSDPLCIIARELQTLPNDRRVWERISDIVRDQEVGTIVVGMPLNLKGEKSQKTHEVEDFVQQLKAHTDRDVIVWDERFTTIIAQRRLKEMNAPRRDRRAQSGRVDRMAAAVILQSYLDSRKSSLNC